MQQIFKKLQKMLQKCEFAIDNDGNGMFYDIVQIKRSDAQNGVNSADADTTSNNIIRQNPEKSTKSDIKYSLRDNEYQLAVNNNDLKKAQELVDEAAQKSGYTIKAYHGTLADNFTEFKKSFIGSRFSFDEKGFFFTDRKSIAEDYARSEFDSDKKGHVLGTYLKVSNPLLVDSQYATKEGLGKVFRDNDAIDVWDNYNAFLLDEANNKRADGVNVCFFYRSYYKKYY